MGGGAHCSFLEKGDYFYQRYAVVVDESEVFNSLKDRSLQYGFDVDPKETYFQRLQLFIDNFDANLADINEALIAGFFRSLGIVRDSVDFFVAVGESLKEQLGITREKEQDFYGGKLWVV